MDQVPVPALQSSFTLSLRTGEPQVVGALATGGVRCHLPVMGGALEGEGMRAEVVSGGENWLRRAGGVTVVEAEYWLRTQEGALFGASGKGYLTEAPHYAGTRITLLFEAADDGPVAWLATRVFVAERPQGSAAFEIARVL